MDPSEDIGARLAQFYRDNNPEKLPSIPDTVKKYSGKYETMIKALEKKYNAKFPASPGSTDGDEKETCDAPIEEIIPHMTPELASEPEPVPEPLPEVLEPRGKAREPGSVLEPEREAELLSVTAEEIRKEGDQRPQSPAGSLSDDSLVSMGSMSSLSSLGSLVNMAKKATAVIEPDEIEFRQRLLVYYQQVRPEKIAGN